VPLLHKVKTELFMEKKETTPRRVARRSYEERNKDKRKQASGNFGTMIPRDLYEEINEFLAKNHITKVQLIFRGYESLKAEYEKETESKT
jgi:hypothetical protein